MIKSFENNYYILYLISVSEYFLLNYLYLLPDNETSNNKNSIEEKILSYSNSYNHLYKNVLQFLTLNKSDYLYPNLEHPCEYFKYVKIIEILNLLKQGNVSVAINFLNLFIDDYINSDNTETVELIINLLYEVLEYDIEFSLNNILKIINRFPDLKVFSYIIILVKYKIEYLKGNNFIEYDDEIPSIKNIKYYFISVEFYKLMCSINKNTNDPNNIDKIINLRDLCNNNKLNRFKYLLEIELSNLYIIQGNLIEAGFILRNLISKKINNYITFRAELILCKIYAKSSDINNLDKALNKLSEDADKFGNILDKIDYYSLKAQIDILNKSHNFTESLFNYIKYSTLASNMSNVHNSNILINNYLLSANLNDINQEIKEYKVFNDKFMQIHKIYTLNFQKEIELYNIQYLNSKKFVDKLKSLIK